jgi:uncharacterized membrane protein
LNEIAAIGSISILFIHALVHIGHMLKIKETGASRTVVILAILTIAIAIILALGYTSRHIPNAGYFIAAGFALAFIIEIGLRLITKRVISRQTHSGVLAKPEDRVEQFVEK